MVKGHLPCFLLTTAQSLLLYGLESSQINETSK
jgi:hypothetical protein